MPEFICNTSPLQYLHQLKSLPLLAALFGQVTVPTAVVSELGAGRSAGYDVPELRVSPATRAAVLALVGE